MLRNRGILVTDFDGTMTLSGSSLHGAVYVLGKTSGLAMGKDRVFQTLGKDVLSQAEKGKETETFKKMAEDWWREQMDLYVREEIGEEILRKTAQLLPPRMEILEILKFCAEENLPAWIVSAGLGNVMRFWLEAGEISWKGLRVLANELYYAEKVPKAYGEIITPWNKKDKFFETADPAEDQKLIFLGDKREDLRWRKSNEDSYLNRGEEVVKIKEFP